MSEKWWVDPAWDPMQDLHDCKHNQSLMIPALQEHAEVIRELTKQHTQLLALLKEDRQTIAMLTSEIMRLGKQVKTLETQ